MIERHLANTIELVFPSAHASHNPNGKSIDSAVFAQLTAESPYTLQWAPLSPKLPLSMGIWAHLIIPWSSLSPQPKRHHRFSRFCTGDRRVSLYFTMGRPFPLPFKIAPTNRGSGPHLICGSRGQPESSTQTASRSVQPFL